MNVWSKFNSIASSTFSTKIRLSALAELTFTTFCDPCQEVPDYLAEDDSPAVYKGMTWSPCGHTTEIRDIKQETRKYIQELHW